MQEIPGQLARFHLRICRVGKLIERTAHDNDGRWSRLPSSLQLRHAALKCLDARFDELDKVVGELKLKEEADGRERS